MVKNKKQTVVVIFGGVSVEHDISIITGVQTLNALKKDTYNIIPIYITCSGEWLTGEKLWNLAIYSDFKKGGLSLVSPVRGGIKKDGIFGGKIIKIDFAYLALHGSVGENGGVQGLLDICKIPYSSCGVLGSSVGMDKYVTKLLCRSQKIPVVAGVLLREEDKTRDFGETQKKLSKLPFPLVVKPNSLGSSIGVAFCRNQKELKDAISFAFMFDSEVLVEKAVDNLVEYNVAVVGNRFSCEVSNIEQVSPDNLILSFEGKYMSQKKTKGMEGLSRIVPAKLDATIQKEIEDVAKKVYKLLYLRGVVRLDFLRDSKTEKIYFNEINTIPGSLANYLFKNHNYNFGTLLEKIKDYALMEDEILSHKLRRFSSTILKDVGKGKKIDIRK